MRLTNLMEFKKDHIKEELGWDSLPSPSNTWSIVCDEVPEGYQWYVYPENYPLSACGVWNIFFTKEMDDIYDILEKAGFTNLSKSCVCH